MNETQQILKAIQGVEKRLTTRLDTMQTDISGLKTGQKNLEEGQNRLEDEQKNISREVLHTKTATEAIIAGLTEVTKAVKSDKEIKIRLENLEEHTGTTNPTKN